MSRKQAVSDQIERSRNDLVKASGEKYVAEIEDYLNCCLQLKDHRNASVEWFYSPFNSNTQAYDYGRMVISHHFDGSTP